MLIVPLVGARVGESARALFCSWVRKLSLEMNESQADLLHRMGMVMENHTINCSTIHSKIIARLWNAVAIADKKIDDG